jgi:hypothetical protein
MSEDSFIKKIILRLSARQRKAPPQPAEQVDPALVRLFQMLERTREDEIPCEEVFELLDHYVELAARHEDAAKILPFVKDHLDRCHNCREEYEALARIIAASSGSESF